MVFPDLTSIIDGVHVSYVAIFLAIVLSGHIVPVPEDAVLFLAGYIAALHHSPFSFPILLFISMIGPFCADTLLFYVARTGGKHLKWFIPRIKSSVMERISRELHDNTVRTVVIARFLPGVRLASPLVAGTIGVRQKSFLLGSIVGSILYGTLFFFLGYFFHEYLPQVFHVARATRHILFGLLPFAIITIIAFYVYRKELDEN
jgi:membrane protein DedA with SNARE-associated domain